MNFQRLDEAIYQSKLSEAEIGRRIGKTRQAINRYRKGLANPSDKVAKDLADTLGVSLIWLQGYDNLNNEIESYWKELNEHGHNKILEYAKDIVLINKYRKDDNYNDNYKEGKERSEDSK